MALRGSHSTAEPGGLPQARPYSPPIQKLLRPTPHRAPPLSGGTRDTASVPRHAFPMASYEEVSVSGYEEFMQVVEQHSGKTIFAYFSGSKDAEGKSWCPDCVQGEARIREAAAQRKWLEGRGYSQIAGWRGSGGSLAPGVPQGDLSFPLAFSYPVPTLLNILRPSRPTKSALLIIRSG